MTEDETMEVAKGFAAGLAVLLVTLDDKPPEIEKATDYVLENLPALYGAVGLDDADVWTREQKALMRVLLGAFRSYVTKTIRERDLQKKCQ